MWLIHPTHRKFIKILRDRAKSGNPVVTTKNDWNEYLKIVRTTKQRLPCHQGLYRIIIRAINRPQNEIKKENIYSILDNMKIDIIEKTLSKAEWKSLGATLKGAYLIPFLRAIIKRL